MSGKNGAIKLVAGNSNPALAQAIAEYLKTPLTKAVVRRFADMEVFVSGVLRYSAIACARAGFVAGDIARCRRGQCLLPGVLMRTIFFFENSVPNFQGGERRAGHNKAGVSPDAESKSFPRSFSTR